MIGDQNLKENWEQVVSIISEKFADGDRLDGKDRAVQPSAAHHRSGPQGAFTRPRRLPRLPLSSPNSRATCAPDTCL